MLQLPRRIPFEFGLAVSRYLASFTGSHDEWDWSPHVSYTHHSEDVHHAWYHAAPHEYSVSEFDYECATRAGDHLLIGTWIIDWGERLIKDRRFQIIRFQDRKTVTRGLMQFVCVDMDSHGVRKMPDRFIEAYRSVAISDWPKA